jgi:hypothetical protein
VKHLALVTTIGMVLLLVGCDGGSSGSSGGGTFNSFVREIPVEASYYYDRSNGESASLFSLQRTAYADDDEILQLPSLANNIFQDWWAEECQHDYDVANAGEIWLNPFLGDTKKLVVGESYHFITEVGRQQQKNPCSFGRAVTGEWSFEITDVSHGEASDNLNIWAEFETGELVVEVLDNGTDYSETVTVEVTFTGQDYNGEITGTVTFEIVKEHIQLPEIRALRFHKKVIQADKEIVIDFFNLPDFVNIQAIGEHIDTTSWISTAGGLSSGLLDGDTWSWQSAKLSGPVVILVNIENDDDILIQRKILVYGAEEDARSSDDNDDDEGDDD